MGYSAMKTFQDSYQGEYEWVSCCGMWHDLVESACQKYPNVNTVACWKHTLSHTPLNTHLGPPDLRCQHRQERGSEHNVGQDRERFGSHDDTFGEESERCEGARLGCECGEDRGLEMGQACFVLMS